MNPNNTIALLDIDSCALIKGNSEINQEILDAFKAQGIKRILLFSSMSFSNVMIEQNHQKESISRKALITTLKKQKFEVLGVITSIDPFYNKSMGKAYEDFYQPLYEQFNLEPEQFKELENDKDLNQLSFAVEKAICGKIGPSEDFTETFSSQIKLKRTKHHRVRPKESIEEIIYSHPEFNQCGHMLPSFNVPKNLDEVKNTFTQLWPWLAKLPNTYQMTFGDKGCMFAFFLSELEKYHPEIKNVVYLDDKEDCLNTAKFLNQHDGTPVNLKTILADPAGAHQDISGQIQNHFEKIIISIPPQFLGYASYADFDVQDPIERKMLTYFNDTVDFLRTIEKNNANGLPQNLTETLSAYLMVLFVNLMSELGCVPDIQNYQCELSDEKNRVTFTCYFNNGDLFQVNFEIKSQLHFSLLGCTLILKPSSISNVTRDQLNRSVSYLDDKEIANELGQSRIYVLNHPKCDKVLKTFPNNSISRNKGTTAALATSGAGIIATAVAGAVTVVTGGAALPFIIAAAASAGAVSLIPGAGALTKKSIDKKKKIKKQKSTVANSAVTNASLNQTLNRDLPKLTANEIKILNDFRTFILNPDTIKLLKLYKTAIDLYPEDYQTVIPPNFLNIITSFLSKLNAVAGIYRCRFNTDIQALIDTLFISEEIDAMDFDSFASCVSAFNLRHEDESYKQLLMDFQAGRCKRELEQHEREREQKRTEKFSRLKNFVQNGGEMVPDDILSDHIQMIADLNERETNINLLDICDIENKNQLNRLQSVVAAMLTQLVQKPNPENNSVVAKLVAKLSELFGHIAELKRNLSQQQIQPKTKPNTQESIQSNVQEPNNNPKNKPSAENQNSNLHNQLHQNTDDPMQQSNHQLQINAVAYGFTLEDVEGDGNCFYYAIVRQLNRVLHLELDTNKELQLSAALRKLACDYIEQHFETFKDFITEDQLAQQRNDTVWVEDIVITALCHALNVNLILVRSDNLEPTIKRLPDAICDLYLGYQVGLHYQSLNPEEYAEQKQATLKAKLEATENSALAVESRVNTNAELSNLLKQLSTADHDEKIDSELKDRIPEQLLIMQEKVLAKIEKFKDFLSKINIQLQLEKMLTPPLSEHFFSTFETDLNIFMKPVLSCYAAIQDYALQTNAEINSLTEWLFYEAFSEEDISGIEIEVLELIKQLLQKYSPINPALSDLICINDVFYEALGGNSSVAENGTVMQGNNSAGFFSRPPSPNNVPGAETPTLNLSPTGSPQ